MSPSRQRLEGAHSRRAVLRGAAGATTAAALSLTSAAPAVAQHSPEPDCGGWFEDVDNYDGTIDKTGQQEVLITVRADGNGGGFAFDPPAVRIDPGTTVTWEWSGDGGVHDVVAEDESFRSEMTDEAGFTFEQTIDEARVVTYACAPHESMGMKGALAVGGSQSAESPDSSRGDLLAIGGGLGLAGVLFSLFVHELGSQSRTDT